MALKPGGYGIRTEAHFLADAQPSEQDVQIRYVLAVPVPPSIELHLTEPAEEQKQIIDAHACAIQMTLRAAILPERRKPSGFPVARRRLEIGVEMNRCVGAHAPSREIGDEMAHVERSGIQHAVRRPPVAAGDWE
jgi:hypothetical protein